MVIETFLVSIKIYDLSWNNTGFEILYKFPSDSPLNTFKIACLEKLEDSNLKRKSTSSYPELTDYC